MSDNKYAFIDEYGAFGFDFEKDGCSTHFIITAIIVDEENLSAVADGAEEVRKKYFRTGEIKSSKVGSNHKRRIDILNDLKTLPFKIFAFSCDKQKIYENCGLKFKKPFYKFLNNIVHQELYIAFKNVTIFADEIGGNEYLKSFASYVKSKEVTLDLFGTRFFKFENSKNSSIIQIADFVSGSLAYNYDEQKKKISNGCDYRANLQEKILRIKLFPETFETFTLPKEMADFNSKYNPQIAEICYKKAFAFIKKNTNTDDETIKQQLVVLNYLLFRFMNRSLRKYIPTKELISQLLTFGYEKMPLQAFRNKIIAKLRDNEVVISSSVGGYKIPSTVEELKDFINHGKSIINPMLSRLRRCNDIIKMGTNGDIDLFEITGCQEFQTILNTECNNDEP